MTNFKPNLVPTSIFLGLILIFSFGCKKYTCECHTRNPKINQIDVPVFYELKGPEKRAKKQCEGFSKKEDAEGYFTTCEIK